MNKFYSLARCSFSHIMNVKNYVRNAPKSLNHTMHVSPCGIPQRDTHAHIHSHTHNWPTSYILPSTSMSWCAFVLSPKHPNQTSTTVGFSALHCGLRVHYQEQHQLLPAITTEKKFLCCAPSPLFPVCIFPALVLFHHQHRQLPEAHLKPISP